MPTIKLQNRKYNQQIRARKQANGDMTAGGLRTNEPEMGLECIGCHPSDFNGFQK